jgi:hypothetical protein
VPTVVDPELDSWRRGGLAPDVAARLAIDASISLRDPSAATEALGARRDAMTIAAPPGTAESGGRAEIAVSEELFGEVSEQLQSGVRAAALMVDRPLPALEGDEISRAQ